MCKKRPEHGSPHTSCFQDRVVIGVTGHDEGRKHRPRGGGESEDSSRGKKTKVTQTRKRPVISWLLLLFFLHFL